MSDKIPNEQLFRSGYVTPSLLEWFGKRDDQGEGIIKHQYSPWLDYRGEDAETEVDYSEHLIAARKALKDAEQAALAEDWEKMLNASADATEYAAKMCRWARAAYDKAAHK